MDRPSNHGKHINQGIPGKHGKSFKYESFYNMEDLVILLSQKAWCSWAVPRRMAVLEPKDTEKHGRIRKYGTSEKKLLWPVIPGRPGNLRWSGKHEQPISIGKPGMYEIPRTHGRPENYGRTGKDGKSYKHGRPGKPERPGNVSRLDKDEQPPMWGGLVSMGVLEA